MRDADFDASQCKLTEELTENKNKVKRKKATGFLFFLLQPAMSFCLLILGTTLHHVTVDVNGKAIRSDGSLDLVKQLYVKLSFSSI